MKARRSKIRSWYSAHIISYAKIKDNVQDDYPLWENIVLIEAPSPHDARSEAERIGKEWYDDSVTQDSGEMTWDGRPAYWVFAGVRKVINIADG